MDEGFTIAAVQAIQETGNQVLPSGFSYTCPAYCLPTAPIANALGSTPLSYRLLAALAGTLMIPLAFLVGRRFFSPGVGMLTAAFVAFSYFQIAWSRQARWYTLFELALWFAVLAFWQALYGARHRAWWAAGAVLATMLAILSHELGWLLPLAFAAWIAIELTARGAISRRAFIVAAALGGIAAFAALLHADPDHAFLLPYYSFFYLGAYWLPIGLAAIALVHPFNRWKRETAFLLLLCAAYVLPLAFLADIVNYRYLFHLMPALFLLAGVGAFAVLSDLAKRWQKVLVLAALGLAFFLSGQGVLLPRTEYFLESDDPESPLLQDRPSFIFVPQPDWQAAYAYVQENRTPEDIVISSQSALTHIYLGEPGYWIRYSYNGKDLMQETEDGRDFYAGAAVVPDADRLRALIAERDGFLVIDPYAERRAGSEVRAVLGELEPVFSKRTNSYSSVTVYEF